jgi:membrane peptidoglycan carboxypeptidase
LANSLNIPAIQVLRYAGLDDTINMAHTLGISSLNDRSRYGLSLVLGGGEVTPLDMASVYSTFATGGIKHQPKSILKVLSRTGSNITKKEDSPGQSVVDGRLTYMLTNILSDNNARSEEFGPNSPLKLSRPAAAKTGTTNDFRDNWTVGYTPSLVTSVWVGNNDHSPMNGVNGITGAAPIWHDFMEGALAGTPVESFAIPAGVTTAKVCAKDGGLANPWDAGYDEVFLSEQKPAKRCNSEQPKPKEETKPDSTQPTNPAGQHDNDQTEQSGGVTPPDKQPPGKPNRKPPVLD